MSNSWKHVPPKGNPARAVVPPRTMAYRVGAMFHPSYRSRRGGKFRRGARPRPPL